MPLVALGIAGAIGGIGGGALAASGAKSAANTAANADISAAQINAQSQREALAFEQKQLEESQREYNQNQTNIAPWLKAGQGALDQLQAMAGRQAPAFTAPTMEEAQNDPGYEFTLQQGMRALQSSAAAKGGLLTTGTLKNLDQFSQGLANTTYNDVYNRNLTTYQTNRQTSTDSFNRLAALAGVGQQASQQIASLPNPYAGSQIPQTLIAGGQTQGNYAASAGMARASGYQNSGNIWGNTAAGLGGIPTNLYILSQLANGGGYNAAKGLQNMGYLGQ